MDLITLRVLNTIHKLSITEEEFKDIEEEQNTIHTGIYIATVKGDNSILIDHDEKHRIMIMPVKDAQPKKRVLFKTLTFKDVPENVYVLHRIGKYKALDDKIKHIANNMEELKEIILMRFTDSYPQELGGEYDDVWGEADERRKAKLKKPKIVEDQLKALYWLFGEDYNDEGIPSRLNIPRIIKVWKHKNKRTALFQEKECWTAERSPMYHSYEKIDRITYKIKTYTPKDKEYNCVCPNREVGLSNNSDYSEVWLDDNLFEKVPSSEIEIIMRLAKKDGFWLLNADKYFEIQHHIKNECKRMVRGEEEEEAKKILVENIQKQFKDGKVVRNGITFTKDNISYEGIVVKGDKMDEYIVRNNLVFLEYPDFNEMIDDYIEELLKIHTDTNYYPYMKTMTFQGKANLEVNGVKIEVVREKGRITVNGYRIAKEDVEEVVKSAIRHKDEYNEYVAGVSKTCLKMQKILKRCYFKFELDVTGTNDCALSLKERKMILVIPVIQGNFIIVNDKQFKIKNVRSFVNLDVSYVDWRYNGSPLQKFCVQLHKAVKDISEQEISLLIEEGMSNYSKQVEEQRKIDKVKIDKSKKFIENAVRISKAVKINDGYLVKGLSGTEYTVNSKTLAVYKGDDYICIVDVKTDNKTEWGLNDAVAKRLLMLSKDVKVAKEVHTLGDKMDAHWQEIEG